MRLPNKLNIALYLVTALASAGLYAAPSPQLKPEVTELILLYEAVGTPATAEQIVEAIVNPNANLTHAALYSRLGSPQAGRLLIHERIPSARRATLSNNDPEELLQRYVVLSYPNSVVATVMKDKLSRDTNVIWVGENSFVELSVVPSDPYVAWAPSVFDYQWGLYALNMFPAWDVVRGHAYVGHVDSGIQINHPDLVGKYRSQFAYNAVTPGASVDESLIVRPSGSFRGHGTHTAGIIAAETAYPNAQYGHPNPPARGVAGMCWNCTLIRGQGF